MNGRSEDRRYSDSELSEAYRELAHEAAPENLNRAVIDHAALAAQRENGARGWSRWYRPLAFAATVGLSLALLLELSEVSVLDDVATGLPPAGSAEAESPFRDAAEAAADDVERVQRRAANAMRSAGDSAMMRAPQATESSQPETTLQAPAVNCSEAQRRSATTWWACIEALEQNGHTEIAEQELQTLLSRFPGFAIPDRAALPNR